MQRCANTLGISTNVTISVLDLESMQLLDQQRVHNLVVTSGRNLVRDLLNAVGPVPLSHFAVGTNNTAAAATQTALVTEIFRDQITQRTASDGVLRLKYFLGTGSANGSTLREVGIFNAATAGIMFARVSHGDIIKTSSISVTYDWLINIGAS